MLGEMHGCPRQFCTQGTDDANDWGMVNCAAISTTTRTR